MIICKICDKEFKNRKCLSNHIRKHNLTIKEYYDKYLKKENEGICLNCGKESQFNNIIYGYKKFCSVKCSNSSKFKKNKIKRTNIKKYGYKNPFESNVIKQKIKDNKLSKFKSKLSHMIKYLNLKLLDKSYINCDYKHKWQCIKCGSNIIQTWDHIKNGYRCPKCFPRNIKYSKGEDEIINFLNSFNVCVKKNDRSVLEGKELDIYIPSKKLAIEFDGLYWHSDLFKDKYYHLRKTELCNSKNIQLIHIFEDEWIYKQDIVKSRLKQILGTNSSKRIHARKCEIKEISPKTKNEFLNKYHLQGEDKSVIKLGAFYDNKLVSIMTFSHGSISRKKLNKYDWELSRFCSDSNYRIPGIASKLLSYFKKNYGWKEIISYADRRWSNGNLYYKLGFKLDLITKPNYWYIKGLDRIHRFSLRKKYHEPKDISEWVLRRHEEYYRIWDCGHYKFIIKNN